MSNKEHKSILKNRFFFPFSVLNNNNSEKGYEDIQKIPFIISILVKRYRVYPRRTLILLIGLGIIFSVLLNDYLGWGTPGYDFMDKLFVCGGLIGCAFGFISPKIELNEMIL